MHPFPYAWLWWSTWRLMAVTLHITPAAVKSNNFLGDHCWCRFLVNLSLILSVLLFCTINPYLAVRDNSRAGGVCQLKSLSYLQYTTCIHSEQVFSYRSERTFIQTRHFSLDSQVLDFTHTKKTDNTKFQAAINFSTHFNKLIMIFWKKKPITPESFPVRKK